MPPAEWHDMAARIIVPGKELQLELSADNDVPPGCRKHHSARLRSRAIDNIAINKLISNQ